MVYVQYRSIKTQSKVHLGKSRMATPISEQETGIIFTFCVFTSAYRRFFEWLVKKGDFVNCWRW